MAAPFYLSWSKKNLNLSGGIRYVRIWSRVLIFRQPFSWFYYRWYQKWTGKCSNSCQKCIFNVGCSYIFLGKYCRLKIKIKFICTIIELLCQCHIKIWRSFSLASWWVSGHCFDPDVRFLSGASGEDSEPPWKTPWRPYPKFRIFITMILANFYPEIEFWAISIRNVVMAA